MTSGAQTAQSHLWTEKYRPKVLNEIINQKEIVERLKGFVQARSMPHCLFAGPPGTGKTTAALCLARDLFGTAFADSFSELNASDERGINVVRERVKTFARTRTLRDVPFKILVLDEADNMTTDAQQALRRTMERYTETCRFVLACNYSSKIIEPIQSRCAPFRFTPLSDDDVSRRIRYIAAQENVEVSEDGLAAIIEESEGDLRKACNTLQAAAGFGKRVDEKVIYTVVGHVIPKEVQEMLLLALKGDFIEARQKLRKMLVEYGVSASDLIRQVHTEIFRFNIPEPLKARLIDAIGEADFRITEGSNDEVQFSALLARLAILSGENLGNR
ncbi:replication factor C small subunit [Candidatus Bathyarchaeota archaeon]|nr:replication factor C small subunit [Candidatus Bathyarchaeota archaeon]